jgi:hypothetical protein
MKHLGFRKGSRVIVALAASMGAATIGLLGSTGAAHGDPAWSPSAAPVVAVGSNTIEDLMDAYSGVAPTPGVAGASFHEYTPLHDTNVAGTLGTFAQVYSWDALNPTNQTSDCISAKPGFAPIARPNGSGDGRNAISDAIAGVNWSKTSAPACAPNNPAGQIDLGRSSGGPGSLAACPFGGANCLAWVDFGHDGVSYAYFINPVAGAPATTQVDHLSLGTLKSIYQSATGAFTDTSTTDGGLGVTFGACFPQTGSGTAGYWAFNVLALAATQSAAITVANTAATANNCASIEENGANGFQTGAAAAFTADAGHTPLPQVMIIPFSTGSWISQNNKVALDRSTTGITAGVALGFPDGTMSGLLPYTGTAPNEAPNTTFYTSAPYGRDLWIDLNNASLNGGAGSVSLPLRRLLGFVATNYAGASGTANINNANTSTGQICQAPFGSTTLNTFGFITPPAPATCGNETLTVINTGNGS